MLNVRSDFPLLRNRPDLCYLDSAATTQKPDSVIHAVTHFLEHNNANIRRGVHQLSDKADEAYVMARKKVAQLIHAKPNEIVFTPNATAGINMVARSLARSFLGRIGRRKIYISDAEHNSNYLPWIKLGSICTFDHLLRGGMAISEGDTRLIAMTHLSNVIGEITPVSHMSDIARVCNTPLLVDAAQSVGHLGVNVTELGADFLVFSAHKMLAFTGLGVLYVRECHHENFTPPYIGGGTVRTVESEGYTLADVPDRLEAGTPPIIEAVSLGAAIDYLDRIGMDRVTDHIGQISRYCYHKLLGIGITPLGGPSKHGLVSFNLDDIHPHDVAFGLDELNIAVRAGHHCAHRCHSLRKLKGSVRASFHVYNTLADVDRLIEGLEHVRRTFRRTQ